jgi:hypothetical protein
MIPFRYLDIENHELITKKLNDLLLNSLYFNVSKDFNVIFSFNKKFENQRPYDIHKHTNFWNFLDTNDMLEKIPEFSNIFKKLDIEVFRFNLIVITKDYGVLHTDAGGNDQALRINWPIYNCDTGTQTHFYKLKTNKTIKTSYVPPKGEENIKGPVTTFYDPDDIETSLGYYVLTQPVLFSYTIPHNVILSEEIKYPRVILSIDYQSDTLRL